MTVLSELALITSGVAPEPVREVPARFVQIRDLNAPHRELAEGEQPRVARAQPIQRGDVLMASRGERTLAAQADDEFLGAYATLDIYLIRPRPDRLDPDFLLAFLLLPQTGARLRSSTAGASLPRIPRDELAKLGLPDLPLDRQRLLGHLSRSHRTYRELLLRLADLQALAAELQINQALASFERQD